MTPEEKLSRAAAVLENAQKIARPLWALIAILVVGGFWFGSFYSQYQDSLANGSPFMRAYIERQQVLDAKRDAAIDRLNDHLDALEKHK